MSNLSPQMPVTIFVVENHADTLKYVVMFLEDLGYTTVQACNMTEALSHWPEAECQILISDIGLPDGDGWDLMTRLRSAGSPPRYAIAMSGFGMNADEGKSRSVGYRHHLIKPFDPEKLEDMLQEAQLELV